MSAQVVAWAEHQPPRQAWVMASYSVMDKLVLTKTCRSGCCVSQGLFCMNLPSYWRDATPEEIAAGDWTNRPPVKLFGDDPFALYISE